MVPLSFAGQEFFLTEGRALFWPQENALLVADLHLEKASFYAQHGQMLPPYDSRETLERVALAIRETGARRVFTLGDNFHDAGGAARLEPHAAGMLAALTRATDWVWITGNHDAPVADGPNAEREAENRAGGTLAGGTLAGGTLAGGTLAGGTLAGGTLAEELEVAGMILRHQAQPGETRPEFSGHYHPRLQIIVRQRHIRRPCAVVSRDAAGSGRMILPAFGALTGGVDAADPAILSAMQPASTIHAMLPAGGKLVKFALWKKENPTHL